MKRKRFAPEVIQSSAMDCGPACLQSLLAGFGIQTHYSTLRDACQTDVDGTSINTIEELSAQLGLKTEQAILPIEHLVESTSGAIPAITIVKTPTGILHFVVLWRQHGVRVQLMDPGVGRRYVSLSALTKELHVHQQKIAPEDWRSWAETEEFLGSVRGVLCRIGFSTEEAISWCRRACEDKTWESIASLDAISRFLLSLVTDKALRRGKECRHLLQTLFETPLQERLVLVPNNFWLVRPLADTLRWRGAVVLRITGRCEATSTNQNVVRVLQTPPIRPAREALRLLWQESPLLQLLLVLGAVVSAFGVLLDAFLLQSLLALDVILQVPLQRLSGLSMLLLLMLVLFVFERLSFQATQQLGRVLENKLRLAFLEKLPKLEERYLRSRPSADLTERVYSLQYVRGLPSLLWQSIRSVCVLVVTLATLFVFFPESHVPLALTVASALLVPYLCVRLLMEPTLKQRSQAAALGRFSMDALLGATALRAHGGQLALQREFDTALVAWYDASERQQQLALRLEGAQTLMTALLSIGFAFTFADENKPYALLGWYLALSLPTHVNMLVNLMQQYPRYHTVLLRILEALSAPETEPEPVAESLEPHNSIMMRAIQISTEYTQEMPQLRHLSSDNLEAVRPVESKGYTLALNHVSALASGQPILQNLSLTIQPREHIAIVGGSGAGKSSLFNLLLGICRPSEGEILLDHKAISYERLREHTALVDPSVQIWNTSLLENILYGNELAKELPLAQVQQQAELPSMLERFPAGLQTLLGESGALVSGGEGQRVRLARALLRPDVRLVLLDEPFRGLDRHWRKLLLGRARAYWQRTTLLCISHDIEETLQFPRVLVLENGQIVEDGKPKELQQKGGSRYRALLEAERDLQENFWQNPVWRKLRLQNGMLLDKKQEKP